MAVAIVGIGIHSPLGAGLDSHRHAWKKGESGFRKVTCFDTEGADFQIAGEISNLWELKVPQKKVKKFVNRKDFLAIATALQAIEDSKINLADLDPFRKAVYVGSCATQIEDFHPYFIDVLQCVDIESITFDSARFGSNALSEINPISAVKVLTNGALAHISQSFEFKGPNCNFMDYELGGFMALEAGVAAIESGRSDISLIGAVSTPLDPFQLSDPNTQYDLIKVKNTVDCMNLFKPGSRHSTGRMVGEAACFFILEDEDKAIKRGASIHGVIEKTSQSSLGQSLPFQKQSYGSVVECMEEKHGEDCAWVFNFNGSPRFDGTLSASLPKFKQVLNAYAPLWQTGDLSESAALYNLTWALSADKSFKQTTNHTYNDHYNLPPSYTAQGRIKVLTMNRFGATGVIEVRV